MIALETKFLHLHDPIALGASLEDGWRVSWLGGWDKHHLFFVVMVVRKPAPRMAVPSRRPRRRSPECR